MGCKKLTYHETLSPLKVVCSNLNISGISCVGSYRYGFQGQERDDEVKGEGNSYDFGARLFDSRVGRWLSRDPLEGKYPSLSPYNFVANTPLIAIDPNGKEIIEVIASDEYDGSLKFLNAAFRSMSKNKNTDENNMIPPKGWTTFNSFLV